MKKILLSSSFILALFNLGAQTTYRLELIAEGNFGTPNGDVFVRNTTVTPATNSTGIYQATNSSVGIDVLQDYAIAGNKAILIGKPSGAGKIIVASYPALQNLQTFSGNAPQTIGVASNTKAYVSYGNPAAMVCIDLVNLTSTPVTGTISSYSNYMVGAGAFMFAQIAGNIVKIDTATNAVVSTISPGVGMIKGLMKNGAGNKLWVMGASGLVSIDLLNADQVSPLISMGISSIGTTRYYNEKIYFWSLATKKLYIYDIATGTVPTAEVYISTLPGNSFSFCYGRSFDIDQTTGDFVVASANNYTAPSYFEVVDGTTFTVIESSTMPDCAIANKCVLKTYHAPIPDVASLPAQTGECSVTLTAPTATSENGTITATTTDPTTYTSQGTFTVNWTYTDGSLTNTQTQTVIIDDITAPATSNLANVTLMCNAALQVPTATDNCAGTITATTSDPLSYSTSGTYTVTWTFSDGNGNTATENQQVVVSCSGVGLSENELQTIALYPNPANQSLNVEFNSAAMGEIAIVDAQGKVIRTQSINGTQIVIDITELMTGIYFLNFGESVNRFSVIH